MIKLTVLTILAYLLCSVLQGFHLFGKLKPIKAITLLFMLSALTGHGFLLYEWVETSNGQNLDPWIMFSLTTWLMGLIIAFTIKTPSRELIPLVFPVALVSIMAVNYYGGVTVIDTKLQPGVLSHIFLSLLAISILFLAAFQASLLWVQDSFLKQHRQSALLRFIPPLETMEKLLFKILWIGLITLTLALLTGALYIESFFSKLLSPKIVLSLGAWGLFATLLIGHYFKGWRGKTAIRLTIGSVFVLFSAYFGTKFLL